MEKAFAPPRPDTPNIEHISVVMTERRSFDHLTATRHVATNVPADSTLSRGQLHHLARAAGFVV